jgi:hypothetical protein
VVQGTQILMDEMIRTQGSMAADIAVMQDQLHVMQEMIQASHQSLMTDLSLIRKSQLSLNAAAEANKRQRVSFLH